MAQSTKHTAIGFDWADAGVGAAGTVVLLGAGSGLITFRRRQGRHAVMG